MRYRICLCTIVFTHEQMFYNCIDVIICCAGFCLGWVCLHHQLDTASCFCAAAQGEVLIEDTCRSVVWCIKLYGVVFDVQGCVILYEVVL